MKQISYSSWLIASIALFYLAMTNQAQAQIASDGTLSTNVTTENRFDFTISGGEQAERNLFHSFKEFSVPEGGSAFFDKVPAGVQNIISRVTGQLESNINGLVKADSSVNLFLINPHGIIFGQNASLNIGGSFVGTTANALQLGSHGLFSASTSDVSSLLTVNPSAFLFNQIAAQPITSQARLRLPTGQNLLLVGGSVILDGGRLTAENGRVELGGLARAGTVSLNVDGNNLSLNFPDDAARADVSLMNGAQVDVTSRGGGSIAITAQDVKILQGSGLSAGTISRDVQSVGTQAGDIVLDATGKVIIDRSRISNDVKSEAVGNTGSIRIKAESLSIANGGGGLSTNTFGQGETGGVFVQAKNSISMDGSSINSNTSGSKKSGDIRILTGTFSLTNLASLSTSTFGPGNAGGVFVQADNLVSIKNKGSIFTVAERRATGDGGDIKIQTRVLSLANQAGMSTATFGEGSAGNAIIHARDTISLTNSFIFSDTASRSEKGSGGNIDIDTGLLSVTGSKVSVGSTGTGMAGNLKVTADSIRLDEKASFSANTTAGPGNITLRSSQDLILRHGSNITTDAQGTANGGNIIIDTGVIAALEDSDISANAQEGPGGRVIITAQDIFRTEGSDITATSNLGPDFNGIVEINTPDVDPTRLSVSLPTQLVNVTGLIAQGCPAGGGNLASQFVITGRGGLPDNPSQTLSSDTVWSDLRSPTRLAVYRPSSESATQPTNSTTEQLVEAQGWITNDKGEVILTAAVPSTTPHSPWMTPTGCHAP